MKKTGILVLAMIVLIFGAGCTQRNKANKAAGQNAAGEQQAISSGFGRLSNSQPIPSFDWSQERQTLIDVERARATGTTTTSSGYLEGVGLVWWCPSIGAPVPSTYQLSAADQWVDIPNDHSSERFQLEQGEPTGVYVGESAGTWTLCLDDNGKKFAKYWEGYVESTVGVVSNYPADKRVVISSATFQFTEKPK